MYKKNKEHNTQYNTTPNKPNNKFERTKTISLKFHF